MASAIGTFICITLSMRTAQRLRLGYWRLWGRGAWARLPRRSHPIKKPASWTGFAVYSSGIVTW